ncbi:cardiotrophin-1 [Gastrophryne carolinensis]
MRPATAALLALSVSFWTPPCWSAPLSELEIITQIKSLATLHLTNATLMLSTYLQYQGAPFSTPGFSFPYWMEKGLPTAAMGYRSWRCLCPGERLLLARDAFAAISEFFQLVVDDQYSLNPSASDLHRLLGVARRASEALLSNLRQAMVTLGYQPTPVQPEPLSWASTDDSAFKRKVRGYVLSREYRDWLTRVPKDMQLLALRRGDSSSQEARDCCRS